MGYHIELVDQSFFVEAKNVSRVEGKLLDMLDFVKKDEEGNIVGVEVQGENKLWDQQEILTGIAPFVRKGSFLEILGEDGDRWRWVLDGEKCYKVTPTITWRDCAGQEQVDLQSGTAEDIPGQEFEVIVTETLKKVVAIRATNKEQACEKAKKAWDVASYVLGSEDFTGVTFEVAKESKDED
jgi:hypothetical protein